MIFMSNPNGMEKSSGAERCPHRFGVIRDRCPGHRQPPGQLPRSQALSRSMTEVRHVLRQHHLHIDII
jgi:hypothetical protein